MEDGDMTAVARSLLLTGLLSALGGHATAAEISEMLAIPSLETKQAIELLTSQANSGRPTIKSAKDVNVKELMVNPPKEWSGRETQATNSQGQTSVPFVAANSMILQFRPNTSQAQVDDYIKSNNLKVVKTFPSIGAVQVETDLSPYFQPNISDNNANDSVVRGFLEASKDFKKDPRIREATPDVILHSQSDITNLMTATETIGVATAKITDWGVQDIQADQIWNEPGAQDGVIVGVMDVGFAKHEDLVFIDFLPDTPREDHGTHVSGIACGSHLTTVGVRGVLPNCFIRARHGDVFFHSAEGGQVTKFLALFSQLLSTLTTFVDGYDDVSTFNISLGYNWISNFGINPDAPDSSSWRAIVDIQGPFLVTLLQDAEKKGKIIFSAAGNDSTGLNPPINAKYASPFNWAALVARERGIKNGVIVEAHDRDGKRAPILEWRGGHFLPRRQYPQHGCLRRAAHEIEFGLW